MELWKRVTVGPDVFEALSSEERISILKLLDQNKQMTGTDVANVLAISKSSAFKQLNRLARAGLVERMDEGRKWIYYRNTSKAERLLHPEDVTITLVLSAALAAVVAGLVVLMAIGPVMGPAGYGGQPVGAVDPALVLSHPTAAGGALFVQVYAGSADLADIAIFIAQAQTGGVVASAPAQASPALLGMASTGASGAPSVSVADANGNGLLDTGDSIAVTGLADASSYTLWVATAAGEALASAPLGV